MQRSPACESRVDAYSPQLLLRGAAQTVYSGIEGTPVVSSRRELALLAQLVAVRLIELHIAQVGSVQKHGQAEAIGFCVQIRQDSCANASGRTCAHTIALITSPLTIPETGSWVLLWVSWRGLPLLIRGVSAEHSDILVSSPPSIRSVLHTRRRCGRTEHGRTAHGIFAHRRELRRWGETDCRFVSSRATRPCLFSAALVLQQEHAANQLACGSVAADIRGCLLSVRGRDSVSHTYTHVHASTHADTQALPHRQTNGHIGTLLDTRTLWT